MTGALETTDRRAAALWFLAALVLYLATAARGIVWADSSKLTLYALSSYFPSLNPGDHAGWTVIARVWLALAGGDPVAAAHRLSALSGALAACLLFLVLRARGADRERAHTAVAVAVVALPVWWAATVAETYLPALALALAGALALRGGPHAWRWPLAGAAFGLALACHALTLFVVVPLLWEAEGGRAWRALPGAALGAAPVWLALVRAPADPLTGFAAASSTTWRWHWEAFVALARVPRGVALLAVLLVYGFGVLGVTAVWRARREGRAGAAWAASLGVLVALLAAYAPYRLHVMSAFVTIGALLAFPVRLGAVPRVAHALAQAAIYLAAPAALTVAGRQDLGVRVLPFRNNAFYFLCPVKNDAWGRRAWKPGALFDAGAEAYVGALGACAPAGAAVLADFNTGAPLRLAQRARSWRTDLAVRPVAVDVALATPDPARALAADVRRELASRPVVLADTFEPYYRLAELAAGLTISPCRVGAVVRARPDGSGQ